MPAFFEYLRNITYYLIFMAVVGVIAPSGNYKKYIALIMGVVLIGIVITPIISGLERPSVPMTELFGNIMPMPDTGQSDFFHWQQQQVRDIFHSQLTDQIGSLLIRNGYELISAEWETSEDFTYIRQIFLTIRAVESLPAPVPFIRVEPVRIAPYRPAEETEETHKLKKLISDFYDMSLDNIHINITER